MFSFKFLEFDWPVTMKTNEKLQRGIRGLTLFHSKSLLESWVKLDRIAASCKMEQQYFKKCLDI